MINEEELKAAKRRPYVPYISACLKAILAGVEYNGVVGLATV